MDVLKFYSKEKQVALPEEDLASNLGPNSRQNYALFEAIPTTDYSSYKEFDYNITPEYIQYFTLKDVKIPVQAYVNLKPAKYDVGFIVLRKKKEPVEVVNDYTQKNP